MLRAVVHAVLASSLVAGPPPSGREYTGIDGIEVEPEPEPEPAPPADTADTDVAEPATDGSSTPDTEVPISPSPATPAASGGAPVVAPDPLAEGPTEDDTVDDVAYDPLVDSPEAIRARSWVRSGAVFMTIGFVLAIGGVAMRTAKINSLEHQNECNPRGDIAGNGCQEGGRNRAAMTLGIPGGLLLAGGIAMVAVGKVQKSRLRASLRASRRDLMLGLQLAF